MHEEIDETSELKIDNEIDEQRMVLMTHFKAALRLHDTKNAKAVRCGGYGNRRECPTIMVIEVMGQKSPAHLFDSLLVV